MFVLASRNYTHRRPSTSSAWREQTPPPTYDLRLRDELRVAAVAFMTLLATRGLYGRIPLLLAATLAVLAGFLVFLGLKLAERPDWRFARLNLRRAGRLTRAGLAAAVLLRESGAPHPRTSLSS